MSRARAVPKDAVAAQLWSGKVSVFRRGSLLRLGKNLVEGGLAESRDQGEGVKVPSRWTNTVRSTRKQNRMWLITIALFIGRP